MSLARSDEFRAVFDHFRVAEADRPAESCYRYSPVFRTVVGGVLAVVKRTRNPQAAAAIMRWVRALAARGVPVVTPVAAPAPNPAPVGDRVWVAYPWIEGRPYDGSAADIAAAGNLLGLVHALDEPEDSQMPAFEWPDHDPESVDAEIKELRRVLEEHAPEIAAQVLDRVAPWHREFMAHTLPAIRDAGLPFVTGSTDFKASNLVYTDTRPVLIDPDNADRLPRILDLAMAALLFHNEAPTAAPRLFTEDEWHLFLASYRQHVALTRDETRLWPTAVKYLITEWGTWTLTDADEWGDWDDPHKRSFLIDLATEAHRRFTMPAATGSM